MARLTDRLILRCTPAELATWKAAAEAAGLSVSEWARRRIIGPVIVEAPPPPPPVPPDPSPAPRRRVRRAPRRPR